MLLIPKESILSEQMVVIVGCVRIFSYTFLVSYPNLI